MAVVNGILITSENAEALLDSGACSWSEYEQAMGMVEEVKAVAPRKPSKQGKGGRRGRDRQPRKSKWAAVSPAGLIERFLSDAAFFIGPSIVPDWDRYGRLIGKADSLSSAVDEKGKKIGKRGHSIGGNSDRFAQRGLFHLLAIEERKGRDYLRALASSTPPDGLAPLDNADLERCWSDSVAADFADLYRAVDSVGSPQATAERIEREELAGHVYAAETPRSYYATSMGPGNRPAPLARWIDERNLVRRTLPRPSLACSPVVPVVPVVSPVVPHATTAYSTSRHVLANFIALSCRNLYGIRPGDEMELD